MLRRHLDARHILVKRQQLHFRTGGDVLVSDSFFFESSHDIIVQNGGALAIDHAEIGSADTYEHCEVHINGGDAFSMTNSVIHGGVYGIMFGGIDGGLINFNNIAENNNDVLDLGGALNADLRYNWVDVQMAALDVDEMTELVTDAWTMVVPKRVAREYFEAGGS